MARITLTAVNYDSIQIYLNKDHELEVSFYRSQTEVAKLDRPTPISPGQYLMLTGLEGKIK